MKKKKEIYRGGEWGGNEDYVIFLCEHFIRYASSWTCVPGDARTKDVFFFFLDRERNDFYGILGMTINGEEKIFWKKKMKSS